MKKVSVIICAYNEEKTIRDVIISIASNNIFDEIIVVNDGSSDKTKDYILDCANTLNIIVVNLPVNRGKGFAMAKGIEMASNEIIFFCDADITNSTSVNFHNLRDTLILPVICDEADMILGYTEITINNHKTNPIKGLTGERVIKKNDVLPILDKIKDSKFGVETLLNLHYKATGKKVKKVLLNDVKHSSKFRKTTNLLATKQYIEEGHQIASTSFKNIHLVAKIIINEIKKIEP